MLTEQNIYSNNTNLDERGQPMSDRPVVSRLVKREKQKLIKQTWIAVILSTGLLVIFILFGIPNAARIIALIAGSNPTSGLSDSIPPLVPVLQIAQRHTNQAEFTIRGIAEAKSQVIIVRNELELDSVTVGDDGIFESSIELEEGENSISAYSVDGANNQSQPSKTEVVTLDTKIPELTFGEGISAEVSAVGKDKQYFTITGQTKPGAKVTINERFLFAKADGSFSYRYRLSEGDNQIKIIAEDKAGNTVEQSILIKFKP